MRKSNGSIRHCLEQVLSDWNNGVSVVDIANKYNVTTSAIHHFLSGRTHKHFNTIRDIDNRKAGRKVSITYSNERKVVFDSIRECSKFLNLDESSVNNILLGIGGNKCPDGITLKYE
jgi:predicted DNA-binding protein YlxM (UPF0122 family)